MTNRITDREFGRELGIRRFLVNQPFPNNLYGGYHDPFWPIDPGLPLVDYENRAFERDVYRRLGMIPRTGKSVVVEAQRSRIRGLDQPCRIIDSYPMEFNFRDVETRTYQYFRSEGLEKISYNREWTSIDRGNRLRDYSDAEKEQRVELLWGKRYPKEYQESQMFRNYGHVVNDRATYRVYTNWVPDNWVPEPLSMRAQLEDVRAGLKPRMDSRKARRELELHDWYKSARRGRFAEYLGERLRYLIDCAYPKFKEPTMKVPKK